MIQEGIASRAAMLGWVEPVGWFGDGGVEWGWLRVDPWRGRVGVEAERPLEYCRVAPY